jgi:adenosylcobinamide-phosphate synthase
MMLAEGVGVSLAPWLLFQAQAAGDVVQAAHHSDRLAAAGALAVVVALVVDRMLGEPPAWAHPVVAMGKVLDAVGQRLGARSETGVDLTRFAAGAVVWCALGAIVVLFYAVLQATLVAWMTGGGAWWLAAMLMGLLCKPLLAWRMLAGEVQAVEAALQQSLAAGRQRLSWLVSRDTAALDEGEVRESAIESLAENLNDSVVAPLFWFVLLGLPGAALYRFANTADAMWGYPGWRGTGVRARWWQWAGKWAARADDALSWVPARLTAALLLAARAAGGHVVPPGSVRQAARLTPSPNGGWPMGAMALALGIRLGKPGAYVLNPSGRVPGAQDVDRALRLARGSVLMVAAGAVAVLLAAMVIHA